MIHLAQKIVVFCTNGPQIIWWCFFAQNCIWHISNKYKVLISADEYYTKANLRQCTSYISECKILEILHCNLTISVVCMHNITNVRHDCTIQINILGWQILHLDCIFYQALWKHIALSQIILKLDPQNIDDTSHKIS